MAIASQHAGLSVPSASHIPRSSEFHTPLEGNSKCGPQLDARGGPGPVGGDQGGSREDSQKERPIR